MALVAQESGSQRAQNQEMAVCGREKQYSDLSHDRRLAGNSRIFAVVWAQAPKTGKTIGRAETAARSCELKDKG